MCSKYWLTYGDIQSSKWTYDLYKWKGFPVIENSLSGARLLEMAGFAVNEYNLYLVYEQNKSEEIKPNENIEIQNGLRFNAVLKPAW